MKKTEVKMARLRAEAERKTASRERMLLDMEASNDPSRRALAALERGPEMSAEERLIAQITIAIEQFSGKLK